jgi:hypothetical protein
LILNWRYFTVQHPVNIWNCRYERLFSVSKLLSAFSFGREQPRELLISHVRELVNTLLVCLSISLVKLFDFPLIHVEDPFTICVLNAYKFKSKSGLPLLIICAFLWCFEHVNRHEGHDDC